MKIDNVILVDKDIEFKKKKKIIKDLLNKCESDNGKATSSSDWPSNYVSKSAKDAVKYPAVFNIVQYMELVEQVTRVYNPAMNYRMFDYRFIDIDMLKFERPREFSASIDYFLSMQNPLLVQDFFNFHYMQKDIVRIYEVPREALTHAIVVAQFISRSVFYVTEKDVAIPEEIYVSSIKFFKNESKRLTNYDDYVITKKEDKTVKEVKKK